MPGKILSYAYDMLDRKIGEYNSLTQNTSTELGAWLYDTEQKGKLTSSTSYGPSGAYIDQVTGYNIQGLAGGSLVTVPGAETGFSGTYLTRTAYTTTGLVSQVTPAPIPGSGLPSEIESTAYDALGNPISSKGANTLVSATTYTPYGEIAQETFGAGTLPVWVTNTYDAQTRDVTNVEVSAQEAAPQIDNTAYAFNAARQITAITDTQGNGSTAPVEQQCYTFDALERLTEAWTAATPSSDGSCPTNPSTAGNAAVGGPEPYWTSWTFDSMGERTSQTQYALSGQTGGNTVSTYTYHQPGQTNAHALTGITTTGPGASTLTGYQYDGDGNPTTYPTAAGTQTMSWNAEGQIASDTTTGTHPGITSYTYDADGSLLIERDPQSGTTTDTLYLDGEEMDYNTVTQAVTGTRYYTFNGDTVAQRVGSAPVSYLISDQHGTNQIAVNANTLSVTRREMDAYGNQIGATSGGAWVNTRGFLDKPLDTATGLTNIGARMYDSTTGRFISCDPVREFTDPQELNGYSYGADNPVNDSDPTGKMAWFGDFMSLISTSYPTSWLTWTNRSDYIASAFQAVAVPLSNFSKLQSLSGTIARKNYWLGRTPSYHPNAIARKTAEVKKLTKDFTKASADGDEAAKGLMGARFLGGAGYALAGAGVAIDTWGEWQETHSVAKTAEAGTADAGVAVASIVAGSAVASIASAALVGTEIGAFAGPVGMLAGAAVGAAIGIIGSDAVGEIVNTKAVSEATHAVGNAAKSVGHAVSNFFSGW